MFCVSYCVVARKARLSTLWSGVYENGSGQVGCYSSFTCDNCTFGEHVQCDSLFVLELDTVLKTARYDVLLMSCSRDLVRFGLLFLMSV